MENKTESGRKVTAIIIILLCIVIIVMGIIILKLLQMAEPAKETTAETSSREQDLQPQTGTAEAVSVTESPEPTATVIPVSTVNTSAPPTISPAAEPVQEKDTGERAVLAYYAYVSKSNIYADDEIISIHTKNVRFDITECNNDGVPELFICRKLKNGSRKIYIFDYCNENVKLVSCIKGDKICLFPDAGIIQVKTGEKTRYYHYAEHKIKKYPMTAPQAASFGEKSRLKPKRITIRNMNGYIEQTEYKDIPLLASELTDWLGTEVLNKKKNRWYRIPLTKQTKKRIVGIVMWYWDSNFNKKKSGSWVSRHIFGKETASHYRKFVGEWGEEYWEHHVKSIEKKEGGIYVVHTMLKSYIVDVNITYLNIKSDVRLELKRNPTNGKFRLTGVKVRKKRG